MAMTPPENDLRDAVAALRKEVRECIGETIPLRRRWVSAIIAGPITRLLTRALAAEVDLAKARADLERVTAERDEAVAGLTQAAANIEKLSAAIHNAAPVLEARALAAEAENTRLRALLVELKTKADGQLAYWRQRMAREKCLDDGVSEDGQTYTPIGDSAAWQGGYCNGRLSEADWWRITLKHALAALDKAPTPKEPSDV